MSRHDPLSSQEQWSDGAMVGQADLSAGEGLPTAQSGFKDEGWTRGLVTAGQIQRAICCPTGMCSSPGQCFAERRDRDVPVRIDEAARAVLKLFGLVGQDAGGNLQVGAPTRIPLTSHKPGIVTLDYEAGVPQDSAWQPQPDSPARGKPWRR
jgi:hypothetical protein